MVWIVGRFIANNFCAGFFSVKGFTDNENKRYTIEFGDEKNMPKGTCQDWNLAYYQCQHFFFAVFRTYHSWQWDVLSPLYISSPFLTLDKLGASGNIDKKVTSAIQKMNT